MLLQSVHFHYKVGQRAFKDALLWSNSFWYTIYFANWIRNSFYRTLSHIFKVLARLCLALLDNFVDALQPLIKLSHDLLLPLQLDTRIHLLALLNNAELIGEPLSDLILTLDPKQNFIFNLRIQSLNNLFKHIMALVKSFQKSAIFLTLRTVGVLHESKLILPDFLKPVGALYLKIMNCWLELIDDLVLFWQLLVTFVLFFLKTIPHEFNFRFNFNKIQIAVGWTVMELHTC